MIYFCAVNRTSSLPMLFNKLYSKSVVLIILFIVRVRSMSISSWLTNVNELLILEVSLTLRWWYSDESPVTPEDRPSKIWRTWSTNHRCHWSLLAMRDRRSLSTCKKATRLLKVITICLLFLNNFINSLSTRY